MEDRGGKAAAEDVGPPLALEAVLVQRRQLGTDLLDLVGVGRKPEAARTAQRIAGEGRQPVEVLLRQTPVLRRALCAEPLARVVVRHRAAAQREAPVAPTRTLPYAARVAHAHAQPCVRE